MLLIGLGMSSFVRLPSLVYKGQMIPGLIIEKNIDILIMFVGLLVLSLRRKDVSWTLTASIVMMSIVPFAIFLFQKYTGIHLLPKFHYTRFTIIALSFLIIVVVGAFDKKATVKYQ